jgi:hypothetical protein
LPLTPVQIQIPATQFAGKNTIFFLSRFGLLGYKIIPLITQVPGMKTIEIFAHET